MFGKSAMTSGQPVQIPRRSTPHLWWAFLVIIAGFILAGVSSIYAMRRTLNEIELIEDRALGSIELAFRLSHDIDVRRRLFEAHIVATNAADMKEIEERLADVNARIAATSRDYLPTIADDAEREEWQKLQMEIADIEPQTDRLIDLSRKNQDIEARTVMEAIDPQFNEIARTMRRLVNLNSTRAAEKVYMLRTLERTARTFLIFLMVAFTIFVLSVAWWVTHLISQRETRMREATRQLEEQNRELDAFAGRVAHDLRGPLTAINLAAFDQDVPRQERTRAIFRRGVKQMETIIQDLLMLSRVSAKTIAASCQTAAVISSAEEDLRPKVEAAGGILRVEAAAATVMCSDGLLRQIVWNLGENAVKYRREGVQLNVEIRGRILPHTYELSVSDNGMGMSPSEAQHAFEAFFRGTQVRSTPGTGLGLSIVKRAVEANGGSVSTDSTMGRGTTFKIHLPLAGRKAA
jgi:signal transduction histidine kinase